MSKYSQLTSDGNATVTALGEVKENQEYILGELEVISSLLNELLDLQFGEPKRRTWLDAHPEDKELRDSGEEETE